MTEHVHEWEWKYLGSLPRCKIQGCGKYMNDQEVVRCLNATERLSVKHARYYAKETRMLALRKYLNGYADILEGKDG